MTPSLRVSSQYFLSVLQRKPKKLRNVRKEKNFCCFFCLFMSLGFKVINKAYLVTKAEAKGLIGRFERKCDDDYNDDIKMNLQEIEWTKVYWICLA